ncbi:DUF3784 domain-containing protein [Blautia sp. RD014234]|nr:DUF3784 domain-containing protein [Blautia parvula]
MKWILWGLTALTGIIAVILLMGKGSFLIAGYNTSRNKEKYNEKRLCRVVGGGLGVIAPCYGCLEYNGRPVPCGSLCDRHCCCGGCHTDSEQYGVRSKREAVQEKDRARDKIYRNASFLFTAVILAVVSFVLLQET